MSIVLLIAIHPLYKAEGTLHASLHCSISFVRTRYTVQKAFNERALNKNNIIMTTTALVRDIKKKKEETKQIEIHTNFKKP